MYELLSSGPESCSSKWLKVSFFPLCGRSRSKARSSLESKLLVRKLRHGRRWSHEAWQITKTKQKTHKQAKPRQDADPPARFASYHTKNSEANSQRDQSPTKKPTKDLQGHSGKNALKNKNMQQTNYDTQKCETCDCVVASKTTNSRVC